MYYLKGFIQNKAFISNNVGAVSLIGELSTYGMSFSRERGEYHNSTYPLMSLITLSSKKEGVGNIALTSTFSDHVIHLCNTVYQYGINKASAVNRAEIVAHIANTFGPAVADLECGAIVNNGAVWVPEWISWNATEQEANVVKIWLCDDSFRKQYDEYEIVVVPPVVNVDNLFKTATEVETMIKSRGASATMDAIDLAKGKNPETVLRGETFEYINPQVPGFTLPVAWYVIVYGPAGDNNDAIRTAITDHLLASSTYTLVQWRQIFPELFRVTEFSILPRWDRYAIPNRVIQSGIYSPITSPQEGTAFAVSKLDTYNAVHVTNNIEFVAHPYRSLSLIIVGGADNRDAKYKISELFSDYISVGTSSTDFNRMMKSTQDWSYMLERMLIAAESLTEHSEVPVDMRRIRRGDMLYIARRFDNVEYLVAAKVNYSVL